MICIATKNNEAYVITIVKFCGKLFLRQGFGINFVIHGAKVMKELRWNISCVFSLNFFINICLVGKKQTYQLVPTSQKTIIIIVAFRSRHGVASRNEMIVTSNSCKG